MGAEPTKGSKWAQVAPAVVLAACIGVVAFWEVMSHLSQAPGGPLAHTVAEYAGFDPSVAGRSTTRLEASSDHPSVQGIASFVFAAPEARSAVVRLVHGYNMPDCMKLKGYTVEELEGGDGRQAWRLTSDIDDVSVWVTSIVRADSLLSADVDIRDIAFPRVAAGDDLAWVFKGFSASSMKHPVRNFRKFMNRKWSNARCDVACFLKLKKRPWMSDTVLALVTASRGASVGAAEEQRVVDEVQSLHSAVHKQLVAWRSTVPPVSE